MKTYWQIVPTGDGYNYLGLEDNKHILCSKEAREIDVSLVFKTEEDCRQYIKDRLDCKKYESEKVMLNEKFYKLD
jgi:hypothetical protein